MTDTGLSQGRKTRSQSFVIPGGLMPLVDIMLATLGVFIVVLATQELVEGIPKIEVAADAALICLSNHEANLVLPDQDRKGSSLAHGAVADTLLQTLPTGGNIVVAIPDSCTEGAPSGLQKLIQLETAMSTVAEENVFFQFRFIPVGAGPYGADTLAAALIGERSWPPITGGNR